MTRNLLGAACLGWLLISTGICHSAEPMVESFKPAVVKRGLTTKIKLVGEGFESVRQVLFYKPGIHCVAIEPAGDFEVDLQLEVDQGCELNAIPFRVVSDSGISNLKTIFVTHLPIVLESNSEAQADKPVPINQSRVAVFGTLKDGDIDRYAVELKVGQRLTAFVQATQLGNSLIDTVITVRDPAGRVIKTVDDTSLYQQDPFLSVVAEEAGRYVVDLNESTYTGDEFSHYVLYLGDFPEPGIYYPAGGELGSSVQCVLKKSGGAVDAEQLAENIKLSKRTGWMQFHQKFSDDVSPAPLPLRVCSYGNILEQEPNDKPSLANGAATALPIAFNGILETLGDVDCFAFRCEAGREYRLDCFSQRLGAPSDPFIEIYNASGARICSSDDWASHDASMQFTAISSDIHILKVSDKLGAGNRDSVYRVEVEPKQKSLTAFLPRADRKSNMHQTIAIPQGNRVLVNLAAKRECFSDRLRLDFEGLSKGVTAPPIVIPEDRYWMPVVLEAASDAPLGAKLVGVRAAAQSESVLGGFEQTTDLVVGTADQLFCDVTVHRLAMAVSERVPFKIRVVDLQPVLPIGGSLDVRIEIERDADFDEALNVSLPFTPPWITCEPEIEIAKGQTRGTFTLNAAFEAEAREWPLIAEAEVDALQASELGAQHAGKKVASKAARLEVAESPIQGAFTALAGEQGSELKALCKVSVSGPTPKKLLARLQGLPNRVTAEAVEWERGDSEIEFLISIPPDAPLGNFNSLKCVLEGKVETTQLSFVIADSTSLQLAAKGKISRAQDGRVLSRLEALRKDSQPKNH